MKNPAMIIDQVTTLNQALLKAMDMYSQRPCFFIWRHRRMQKISYARFQNLTYRLVNFLHKQGITSGERVVIIADNPLEWMVAYVACLLSGGVVVPLQAWQSNEMIYNAVEETGAQLALVQGEGQNHIVRDAGTQLPNLKTIVTITPVDNWPETVIPITSVLAKGVTEAEVKALRTHAKHIPSDANALIYYKNSNGCGVLFDHARRLAAMRSMAEWMTFNQDDVAMTTILSWSLSSVDAALHYFLSGVPHIVTGNVDNSIEIGRHVNPTVMLTTPSGPEGFYNRVLDDINSMSSSRQALFQWALSTAKEYRAAGLSASKDLREEYARADRAFFSQLRAKYAGSLLQRVYVTGASLSEEVVDFVEVINGGGKLLNVYSLTEAGGFPAVSRMDAQRVGSCGQVAPGFQISIADDGEVLVRGPMIMGKYWRRPTETEQIIDEDGWLHTGDLGRFDQDGYLYLTGHKQSPMVLSTGRKLMPNALKNTLIASPYIEQAVIIGEGRPYVTALIVPNHDVIQGKLASQGIIDGITHNDDVFISTMRSIIDDEVKAANNALGDWRQIKKYTLLEHPLTYEGGELTGSGRICRETVMEKYHHHIEAMYPQMVNLRVSEEEITEVKIAPNQLSELLEKQDILDAWLADAGIGFMFDLARSHQIDTPSMVHICETAASIAQMQSEEKPLSTALVVGNHLHVGRHLPESEIQLQRYDHIRRMRQIVVSLAKLVDGIAMGYVLDKHGYVRGIHKLGQLPDGTNHFLLGPQFRHHAYISEVCEAVVFFVPYGGRQVRVFAEGHLVGRYANGSWSAESIPEIGEAVIQLAERRKYDETLVKRILRAAFRMSEQNLGAIFMLGDAEMILDKSDPPQISSYANIVGTHIDNLSDYELINFAKQDGATVIDTATQQFRGCMVLLRPSAGTEAEVGLGKGARHSSAAKMSAEAQCLAITISQDGPITVYDAGRRVLSI